MNQQLATLRPGEYPSNVIIKSEKALNSSSNFHLKTDNDRQQEQHRSPQAQRADFRQTTWRKPRMPYNKFPESFQMRHKKKSTNKQVLEDLDKMLKQNEYKEVQKYLNPISLEKRSEQKSKAQNQNGNPLATYQKYLKIKKEHDISLNKYKNLSTKTFSSLRVSDCITLQVIKRGHNTGTLKKMLHVPTLKLLCVRQQPLNTKQTRQSIKEWVNFWQDKFCRELQQNQHFLQVYGTMFNYPEGAVSILTQYHEQGSLLDLLAIVLTLPQSVIRQIFLQVCGTLKEFYEATEMQFGGLSPSQILLRKDEVKLGMGLYYHFTNTSSNSIYHIKAPQKMNIFEMNITQKNFMKSSIDKPLNLQIERSLDIFKLGLIMLECAIGGFQNYEQSGVIHEALKYIFTEEGQKSLDKKNICCLIHYETYLLDWAQREQSIKTDLDFSKVISYMKFLKDRFSVQFINFLCCCLKLSHSKRSNINQIYSHTFLKSQGKDCHTVNISLENLLSITNSESDPLLESMHRKQEDKLQKFIGHVLQVLSNCNREEVNSLLKSKKERILSIGKYIGLSYPNLGEKLLAAIEDLLKSMK